MCIIFMEIDFPFECQSSYLKNTNKYSWNIQKKKLMIGAVPLFPGLRADENT